MVGNKYKNFKGSNLYDIEVSKSRLYSKSYKEQRMTSAGAGAATFSHLSPLPANLDFIIN